MDVSCFKLIKTVLDEVYERKYQVPNNEKMSRYEIS